MERIIRNRHIRVSNGEVDLVDKCKDKLLIVHPERSRMARGEVINRIAKQFLGINTEEKEKEMVKLF